VAIGGWTPLFFVTFLMFISVKLRRARLVPGLVTIFGGSVTPVLIQATHAHSAQPSLLGLVHWVLAMVAATFGVETAHYV